MFEKRKDPLVSTSVFFLRWVSSILFGLFFILIMAIIFAPLEIMDDKSDRKR